MCMCANHSVGGPVYRHLHTAGGRATFTGSSTFLSYATMYSSMYIDSYLHRLHTYVKLPERANAKCKLRYKASHHVYKRRSVVEQITLNS